MKEAFREGVILRWRVLDGGQVEVIKYLGECFYLVRTIPERRELVGHEDDLILEMKENNDGIS